MILNNHEKKVFILLSQVITYLILLVKNAPT